MALIRFDISNSSVTADFSPASPRAGRYAGVAEADYFAAAAVNASTLKHMGRSPLHCQAAMNDPQRQDTEAQRVGRLVHCAVLEPARFAADYCRAPDPAEHPAALLDHAAFKARARDLGLKVTGTKAELKARILEADPEVLFWEDHAQGLVEGREALKADHWHLAQAVLASVGGNDKARAALTGGVAEETLVWLDGPTGLLAKARLDYYREDLGVVFDVKTTEDARPEAVARDILKWGYHVSAAHYLAGLEALGLPAEQFAWIFVEKKAPFAVGLYVASAGMLDRGRELCRQYLGDFARCRLSGVWPGYPGAFQPIDLPAWAQRGSS